LGRLLFAIFLLVPMVEIALFILLGNAIGLWPTLLGVLVTALVGSIVLRVQGIALFNEIRGTMAQGMLPARALGEAMMVAIAGVLLLTPGYFTDTLGLLLLVPPLRAALYEFLKTRMQVVVAGASGPGPRPDGPRGTIDLDSGDWRNR
jgi:UPF0716 protein FxsA